jgi:2-polyprenyl-3-methyl-5-hydroxy-6-metoxy-1,4-benzoquinol methylase
MKSPGAKHSHLFNRTPEYFAGDRRQMLKYIPPNIRRTLEFGCGFGGFSALLKEKFSVEAWTIEINTAAAQEATKKLDRVINADAADGLKGLPDEYFGCIIFLDILEHLADPYPLLLGVKSKLAKDGCIVASIPNIRYYRALVRLVIRGEWDYKEHGVLDRTHLRFFTYRSIIKMFEGLEYEILKLEGINPTHSRTYKILNALLLNRFSDVRYKQFAVVTRPKPRNL